MARRLPITFDSDLIEFISSNFDLREPNKRALRQLIFTLDGDYDPAVMQVLDIATGVGKTYLMAAFMEYLRKQGIGNVVIVTPGRVIQSKTQANFNEGNPRYIPGADVAPDVVTPQDYTKWIERQNGSARLAFGREIPMLAFIFNIQQLIAPNDADGDTKGKSDDAQRRKSRKFDENAGVLFDYLKSLDDLVVIADESHLYSQSAAAFHAALIELDASACIGLTGSASTADHVIYRYPLYQAIAEKHVKAPVLAFRRGGYGVDAASEEQQLRDAMQLRAIKQAYYDSYAASKGRSSVNAVMFVVCADVDHATQTANLLKAPEFFGSELTVLQVDSKHEDETTTRRLEMLDDPSSGVMAVVSVNKLKEGWDVKNVAVIVALRTMASEVLTQQTMGRGLRLPFGRYTDVWQIDQLDIIAHQSFRELLESENVLRQFGLEEAVAAPERDKASDAIKGAVEQAGRSGDNHLADDTAFSASPDVEADEANHAFHMPTPNPAGRFGGVGVSTIEDALQASKQSSPVPVVVEANPRLEGVSYQFPVTSYNIDVPPINLSQIDDSAIIEAAQRVADTGEVLIRKEVIASLGKGLIAHDVERVELESLAITQDEAVSSLVKLVSNLSMVPKDTVNLGYVENYLVRRFVSSVTFGEWSVKSLASACELLKDVISTFITDTMRGVQAMPVIRPKEMSPTSLSLPIGETVHDQINGRQDFSAHRYYRGWMRSFNEAVSFDSYSGEYELAVLLDTSPHIVWWQRLNISDRAYIYYNPKDRYYPDFVAKDDQGVHWIIEGKSTHGRDDAVVQAKRDAATALVRLLAGLEPFAGVHWGYLVAYEDDIAKSDSWDDLKARSFPISNKF